MTNGTNALLRITEYLNLDLETDTWRCDRCGHRLGPAGENYKRGCLVHNRDPREIHPPLIQAEYSFAPDPNWIRIVEFYCPGCGTQIETEYLPPGHPITHDIQIDVAALKARLASDELRLTDGRLEVVE